MATTTSTPPTPEEEIKVNLEPIILKSFKDEENKQVEYINTIYDNFYTSKQKFKEDYIVEFENLKSLTDDKTKETLQNLETRHQNELNNFYETFSFIFSEDEKKELLDDKDKTFENSKNIGYIDILANEEKSDFFSKVEKKLDEKISEINKIPNDEKTEEQKEKLLVFENLKLEFKYKKQALEINSFEEIVLDNNSTLKTYLTDNQKWMNIINPIEVLESTIDNVKQVISILPNSKDFFKNLNINDENNSFISEETKRKIKEILTDTSKNNETKQKEIQIQLEKELKTLENMKNTIVENYNKRNNNNYTTEYLKNKYRNFLTTSMAQFKDSSATEENEKVKKFKKDYIKAQFLNSGIETLKENNVLKEVLLSLENSNRNLFKVETRPFSQTSTILKELIKETISEKDAELKKEISKNQPNLTSQTTEKIDVFKLQNKIFQTPEFNRLETMKFQYDKIKNCISSKDDKCKSFFTENPKLLLINLDGENKEPKDVDNLEPKDVDKLFENYIENYSSNEEKALFKQLNAIKQNKQNFESLLESTISSIINLSTHEDANSLNDLNNVFDNLFNKKNLFDINDFKIKSTTLENKETIDSIKQTVLLEFLEKNIENKSIEEFFKQIQSNPDYLIELNLRLQNKYKTYGFDDENLKKLKEENFTTENVHELLNAAIISLGENPKNVYSSKIQKVFNDALSKVSFSSREEKNFFEILYDKFEKEIKPDMDYIELEKLKEKMKSYVKTYHSDLFGKLNDVDSFVNTTFNNLNNTKRNIDNYKINTGLDYGQNLEKTYTIAFKDMNKHESRIETAKLIEFINYQNHAMDTTSRNDLMRIFFEQDPAISSIQKEDNTNFASNMRNNPDYEHVYKVLQLKDLQILSSATQNIANKFEAKLIDNNIDSKMLTEQELIFAIVSSLADNGIILHNQENDPMENHPYVKNLLPILKDAQIQNNKLNEFLIQMKKDLSTDTIDTEKITTYIEKNKINLTSEEYEFLKNIEKKDLVTELNTKDNFASFLYKQNILPEEHLKQILKDTKNLDTENTPIILQKQIQQFSKNLFFNPVSSEASLQLTMKGVIVSNDENNLYLNTRPMTIDTKLHQLALLSIPNPNPRNITAENLYNALKQKYFQHFDGNQNASYEQRVIFLLDEEKEIRQKKLERLAGDLSKKESKHLRQMIEQERKTSEQARQTVTKEFYNNPLQILNPFLFIKIVKEHLAKTAKEFALYYQLNQYSEEKTLKRMKKDIVNENTTKKANVSTVLAKEAVQQTVTNAVLHGVVDNYKDLTASTFKNLSETTNGQKFINTTINSLLGIENEILNNINTIIDSNQFERKNISVEFVKKLLKENNVEDVKKLVKKSFENELEIEKDILKLILLEDSSNVGNFQIIIKDKYGQNGLDKYKIIKDMYDEVIKEKKTSKEIEKDIEKKLVDSLNKDVDSIVDIIETHRNKYKKISTINELISKDLKIKPIEIPLKSGTIEMNYSFNPETKKLQINGYDIDITNCEIIEEKNKCIIYKDGIEIVLNRTEIDKPYELVDKIDFELSEKDDTTIETIFVKNSFLYKETKRFGELLLAKPEIRTQEDEEELNNLKKLFKYGDIEKTKDKLTQKTIPKYNLTTEQLKFIEFVYKKDYLNKQELTPEEIKDFKEMYKETFGGKDVGFDIDIKNISKNVTEFVEHIFEEGLIETISVLNANNIDIQGLSRAELYNIQNVLKNNQLLDLTQELPKDIKDGIYAQGGKPIYNSPYDY